VGAFADFCNPANVLYATSVNALIGWTNGPGNAYSLRAFMFVLAFVLLYTLTVDAHKSGARALGNALHLRRTVIIVLAFDFPGWSKNLNVLATLSIQATVPVVGAVIVVDAFIVRLDQALFILLV
jgi:hypothetical protein